MLINIVFDVKFLEHILKKNIDINLDLIDLFSNLLHMDPQTPTHSSFILPIKNAVYQFQIDSPDQLS